MVKSRSEKGQAIPLLILALGLVLMGGLGLAIDGAQLYSQSQIAQVAADAAATAGAMSMFQGVNIKGSATFFDTTKASITCTTTDKELPCQYAQLNGFGTTANDQVVIDFPTCTGSPDPCGYESALSTTDTINQIRVTITRNVSNSFIRMLGGALTTPVKASATAAIVMVQTPAPMIILHPTNSDTLDVPSSITITGGPSRSIQVNSSSATAFTGGTVDLSKAGPDGTGADFGVFGGAYTNPGVSLGTTGHYFSKASPIQDPFASVAPPPVPPGAGSSRSISSPTDGCQFSSCTEYSPGTWPSLSLNGHVLFKPGVYYIQGGGMSAAHTTGGDVNNTSMCTGCADDPDTKQGILIYDTGAGGGHTTGGFGFGTQNNIVFQGPTVTTTNALGQTVPGGKYYNIVFWEDHQAQAQTHTLGQGNGGFAVVGTIYMTNTVATMQTTPAHFQKLELAGNPSGITQSQGSIIVDEFALHDAATVFSMYLVPYGFMEIRQVALVGGGPHP